MDRRTAAAGRSPVVFAQRFEPVQAGTETGQYEKHHQQTEEYGGQSDEIQGESGDFVIRQSQAVLDPGQS